MVETEKGRYTEPLHLKEGWLCLDFANTALWHASSRPTERLKNYADLVAWAQRVGILSDPEAEYLLRRAKRHPKSANAALKQAIALREMIYRIFSAVAHDRSPETADLASLNKALSKVLVHSQVISMADGFIWDWSDKESALDRMIWPAAWSAAGLLTSEALRRVGECAADDRGCGWLFLDQSKNHSRRWCDMAYCGNRAKVLRYYARRPNPGKKKPA